MNRVYIVVEGPTEESFVNKIVAPELMARNLDARPIVLGTRGHKGGNVNYARVSKDVRTLLKQHRAAYCSTMLDFYRLGAGFPGMPLPDNLSSHQKVIRLEEAMQDAMTAELQDYRIEVRYRPYLQLHEYEALLFSDPAAFAAALESPGLEARFQEIRSAFNTPEHINDGPQTSPSKRILSCVPTYSKVIDGTSAAEKVTIQKMRKECRHFDEWILWLETLGN